MVDTPTNAELRLFETNPIADDRVRASPTAMAVLNVDAEPDIMPGYVFVITRFRPTIVERSFRLLFRKVKFVVVYKI
jgi:hypothetical protein